jgi:ATP-binding cassette subfamily C protein
LPALGALFDLPFTPLFVVLMFLFHPWLGWLSVVGGALVIALALATQVVTKEVVKQSQGEAQAAFLLHRQTEAFADYVVAQGLLGALRGRWQEIQTKALATGMLGADRAGALGSASKALRLFLQSAMLGMGAWLALKGEVSAGAMIAASILLGRALAPIEQVVGQWPALQKSWIAWGDLKTFLDEAPLSAPRTPLPRPAADVGVSGLTVVPGPGKSPLLQGVSFILAKGQALGVIGPSGSGKTTLARVLTGLVPPSMGEVRLGGATLDQYGDDLGRHVGYLPQMPQLFDATIAENIARMDPNASPEVIIAAAQAARAHELILGLGKGYDTSLRDAPLSGGQMQRVALARALYGNPALLVVDEPTSALDEEGSRALNEAILAAKAEGRSVVLMTHRPSAIAACDLILKLEGGRATAFGPRDEVLGKTVRNFPQIKGTFVQGAPS